MLAEILYRVRPLELTAVTAACIFLCGCMHSGARAKYTRMIEDNAAESTSAGEAYGNDAGDPKEQEDSSQSPLRENSGLTDAELVITARDTIESFVTLTAKKDKHAGDFLGGDLSETEEDERLFNKDYPGEAKLTFDDFSAIVRRNGDEAEVAIRFSVEPENENMLAMEVRAKVGIKNGEGRITSLEEIETAETMQRRAEDKAERLYRTAVEAYRLVTVDVEERMHHKGEGGQFMNLIDSSMYTFSDVEKDAGWSVAVYEGRVMYVSWSDSDGIARYPEGDQGDLSLQD